jgi:hypothetical protein
VSARPSAEILFSDILRLTNSVVRHFADTTGHSSACSEFLGPAAQAWNASLIFVDWSGTLAFEAHDRQIWMLKLDVVDRNQ